MLFESHFDTLETDTATFPTMHTINQPNGSYVCFLEAIISMTLDPFTCIISLPSKVAMVHHLRSLLKSILSGGGIDKLHSLTIIQSNALWLVVRSYWMYDLV